MTKRISFSGRGGEKLEGALAEPSGSGKAGAVVLVQEWWGVNDHVKSLVDRLAAEGFLVLAPDLFHGKTTRSAEEAGKWMQALDKAKAVQEIGAAAVFLREHERSSGKVAVMGFCMGGALSFASAAMVPGLAAVVPFYGLPGDAVKDWSTVTAPIQAHFAKRDGWATVAGAEAIQKELARLGKPMELHTYDADHAFVNDTRPEVYSADNAKLAWKHAVEFLRKHLA